MSRLFQLAVLCIAGIVVADPPPRSSEPTVNPWQYSHEGVSYQGWLSWDSATRGLRPAILIAHEKRGNDPTINRQVRDFAKLGYVCASADLIGQSSSANDEDIERTPKNRLVIARRLQAALDALKKQKFVAPHKVAGIGYGIGATAFLDLARADADLAGVACLHGDWVAAQPTNGKITCRVLALMGSDDPRASLTDLASFEREMQAAGADWDVIRYGGVGRDFTNERSLADPKTGLAHDPEASRRANQAIQQFLDELFPKPRTLSIAGEKDAKPKSKLPAAKDVPDKVYRVLQHIDEHDRAMDGYEGGRSFGNFEGRLPIRDRGIRVRYREWDVNPLRPGVNRGPERLVTGSDGSAYYTNDHYSTFKKIR